MELQLTSDTVSYDGFPRWAKSFFRRYEGKVIKRIDGPDCRVQRVRLLGQELQLVFDDFPVRTFLVADTQAGETVLHAILELEKRAGYLPGT